MNQFNISWNSKLVIHEIKSKSTELIVQIHDLNYNIKITK